MLASNNGADQTPTTRSTIPDCASRQLDAESLVFSRLLALAPQNELEQLLPRLERVSLKRRQVLQEPNIPVQHAFFIESGAVSVVCREGRGGAVEVGTLGSLDFTGVPVLLGSGRSPHRCIVQDAGQALRISATPLADALDELPGFRRLLLRYLQVVMTQSAQLAVCNTRHSLTERLARSLLLHRECLQQDVVPLTHDCLSRALGVRRASVTTTVGAFEAAGLIRRGRGELVIVSPDRLEQVSCACHRAVAAERRRLASPPTCCAVPLPRSGGVEGMLTSGHA